jgi:hypothetical protein
LAPRAAAAFRSGAAVGIKEALPEFLSDDEGQAGEIGEIEPAQAVAAE